MKKLFAFVFVMLIITMSFVSSFSVSAADFGCHVDTASNSVLIENLDTNTIVYEKNADEKTYPASLTKIMTYIVVAENIPDLVNTKVTIRNDVFEGLDPQSTVAGLQDHVGKTFSVLDLLYGLMIPSGNDAALVLADYVGDGVVANFVDLMNRKAGQLGCQSTHFVNPHGLHDPMHYTTARDMSIISQYAYTMPYFAEVTSTLKYTLPGATEPLVNTNHMINPSQVAYYDKTVVGGKTGYTDEAGKCLVTTAKSNNYEYMCVTLGAPYSFYEDINFAMNDSSALYEWAFEYISVFEVLSETEVVRSLPVAYVFGERRVDVVPEKSVGALLPNDHDKSLITTAVQLPPTTKAPLKKGQVLGTINVFYDGEQVGTTNLVSSEDIEVDNLSLIVHAIIDFVSKYIVIILISVCLIIILIIVSIYRRKQRKKRESRYRYR